MSCHACVMGRRYTLGVFSRIGGSILAAPRGPLIDRSVYESRILGVRGNEPGPRRRLERPAPRFAAPVREIGIIRPIGLLITANGARGASAADSWGAG